MEGITQNICTKASRIFNSNVEYETLFEIGLGLKLFMLYYTFILLTKKFDNIEIINYI